MDVDSDRDQEDGEQDRGARHYDDAFGQMLENTPSRAVIATEPFRGEPCRQCPVLRAEGAAQRFAGDVEAEVAGAEPVASQVRQGGAGACGHGQVAPLLALPDPQEKTRWS
jgi:hypothetical protein